MRAALTFSPNDLRNVEDSRPPGEHGCPGCSRAVIKPPAPEPLFFRSLYRQEADRSTPAHARNAVTSISSSRWRWERNLGYYSGEDMPEKTSMMAHSECVYDGLFTMWLKLPPTINPLSVFAWIPLAAGMCRGKFSLSLSAIGKLAHSPALSPLRSRPGGDR